MHAQPSRQVRPPAVAGSFYPASRGELCREITQLLSAVPQRPATGLRALIAPHAGYAYSGPTAAHAFRRLTGAAFRRVIVLGPSHFARFNGASLPAASAYATPLGEVPISPLARELAGQGPFVREAHCPTQRPPWGRPWPPDEATPETWEHAIEVEVPFLQQTLGDVELLPVIYGHVDPLAVAESLSPLLDPQTLLVVSSDLSHFHSYREAQALDQSCVEAICTLDEARMAGEEACGRAPILTLLRLARQRGWRPQLLDLRNSGDTAGDRSRVVGYAAVAFFDPASEATAPDAFTAAERDFLLHLARESITRAVRGEALPDPAPESVPPTCRARLGCFVTLHLAGRLRGCIGTLNATQPLFCAVIRNARDAALKDTRFAPVAPDEVRRLHLEISVLTEPQPLAFRHPAELLAKLRPGRDGVLLELGPRRATFLPQVWEQLPDREAFLNQLAAKAGAASDAWRGPDARVSRYDVEHFAEPPPSERSSAET